MTEYEAIEKLKEYDDCAGLMMHIDHDTCIKAIEALEEVQEYRKLIALEQARNAAIVMYAEYMYCPEDIKKFEMIEKALGFKLYSWQKSYLVTGHYRRIGSTTAECLKSLLFNHTPIDYSKRARNMKEDCERHTMYEIQAKLQAAGIATNPILRSEKEKADYMREKYINEVRFGKSVFEVERGKKEGAEDGREQNRYKGNWIL